MAVVWDRNAGKHGRYLAKIWTPEGWRMKSFSVFPPRKKGKRKLEGRSKSEAEWMARRWESYAKIQLKIERQADKRIDGVGSPRYRVHNGKPHVEVPYRRGKKGARWGSVKRSIDYYGPTEAIWLATLAAIKQRDRYNGDEKPC